MSEEIKEREWIAPVTESTRGIIQAKTVTSLPNNPSERGMSADQIKAAFWRPVTDAEYSVLAELERVIREANAAMDGMDDAVDNMSKKVDELVTETRNILEKAEDKVASVEDKITRIVAMNGYFLPTVYFTGDISTMTKDDKVTLNYTYGERSGTCTLKWQGSSSLAYPKKNYTVVFDNAFEAADGWGEHTKYCLKADWIDFSHCRNVCSAKLWGEIVKARTTSDLTARLSALPNGGAIDGFPCFVVINDEWQGIYNFNIPKDGYMFGMGSGEREAILCANNGTNSNFNGEVVFDRDFELEYHSDTFPESDVLASFNTLVNAVMNSDGTDIDTSIAQYLDIDSAIDYYILTVILRGIDIIGKNAIFATYDGVKWFMSAYDLDSTWGLYWDGSKFIEAAYNDKDDWSIISFYRNTHKLFKLLYTYKKPEIVARYKELRASLISPSYIEKLFRNYAKNIPHSAFDAENALWKDRPSTGANNVEQIIQWYSERIKWVDAEIAELEEKIEQVATSGLAYIKEGHPEYGEMVKITGIGTATDTDVVVPRWIDDSPVYAIADQAFLNNTDITSLEIPEGITALPFQLAYQATNLTKVKIPESVTILGGTAFGLTGVTELTVPNGVAVIPPYFAYGSNSLTSVRMGNRVTRIDELAFAGCEALANLRLPNELKSMGDRAFNRCFGLTAITIPKKVKTIGANAFSQCWNITKLVFESTPESIGADALFEVGGDIYVPWAEGAVAGAPWGAQGSIHYNSEV